MTGCACTEPPQRALLELSPDLSYGFGLAVVDIEIEDLEAERQPGSAAWWNETDFRWDLATFRFVQSMGSAFLNIHGLRLVKTAVDALASVGGSSDAQHEAAARFAAQATLLSERTTYGLSCFDLLESAATLEAHRRYLGGFGVAGKATPVSLYLEQQERLYPDPASPQRYGFKWLSNRLGPDDAYLLLAPLTFLSFIADDPVEMFMRLAQEAIGATETLRTANAPELLAWAGIGDRYADQYLLPVASGEPVGTQFITDPLCAALQIWGVSSLLEAFCRPSVHIAALPGDQATFRHLLPPVQLVHTRSGELTVLKNGLAASQPGLAYDILGHAGVVAAAQRLTLPNSVTDHVCWHVQCPVFATGLCWRWYYVPSAEDGHDTCLFPQEFAGVAGMAPADAWAARSSRA